MSPDSIVQLSHGLYLEEDGYRLDPMYDYYRFWEPIQRTLLREEGEHWQHEQEGVDLTPPTP
jgi:hypothetical protein